MDRREVAAVLTYVGRLAPRTIRTAPGEARDQVAQWQELLDDVPFATDHGWDVREAIRAHVLNSPYPILPVDVDTRLDQPVAVRGRPAPQTTVWHCPVHAAPEDPILSDAQ
ncbi:hypothetical protein ACH4F0_03865 [Streptomyces chartreusis]|uniref:hypothetical protein n=1 Tax=Streptomyces chartreusis TaxID=1969 RepID=UPI0037A8F07E